MAYSPPARGQLNWDTDLNNSLDALHTASSDAGVAGYVNDSASSTRAALNGEYAARVFQVDAPVNNAATDKAAINAKIAAANAAGGGIVQLRPGTYFTDAALTALANGVEIRGHGPYATVIRTSSATEDIITSSGTSLIGVRDLQLESLVARTAGSGIAFTNVMGYVIDNVRFVDTYNCGTFDTASSGWLSRIKVAHGTATLNRGFWFQSCVSTHCTNWLINGGNASLGSGKAWVQVDSGCDTFDMRGIDAVASSGTGIVFRLSHTLSPASFAPRWIRLNNFYFEGSHGGTSGAEGLVIEDCQSAYFTNGYLTTSLHGANITGGKDIRFAQTIFLNNWLYGAVVNSNTAPKLLSFTDCTFSDNSTGANGNVPHLYLASGATSARVTGCSFSNDILGNANKVSYAISNNAPQGAVKVHGCYFKPSDYVSGVLAGSVTPDMRANQGYNPVGKVGPPAVPASTVAYTNAYGVDCAVHVAGGTVTAIAIGGNATGATSGTFRVPAGQTITLTYSVAPTWTWFGD